MMVSFTLVAVGLLVVGVSQTVAMPHPRVGHRSATLPIPEPRWQSRVFDDLGHVEAWLDKLEACGVTDREFSVSADKTFLVRWR